MNAKMMTLGAALIALAGTYAAAASASYEGDFLPNSGATSPQWNLEADNTGGTGSSVAGGILTISTTPNTQTHVYRLLAAPGGWDPTSDGSSIDVKLKVDSVAPGAARSGDMFISTASQAWLVRWGPGAVSEELFGGSFLQDNSDAFHTYKFVIPDSTNPDTRLQVYVDGAVSPTAHFNGIAYGSGARLDFGDTLDGDGGVVQWDYIRWTNNPVPEPASLSLIAAGGMALLRRRR